MNVLSNKYLEIMLKKHSENINSFILNLLSTLFTCSEMADWETFSIFAAFVKLRCLVTALKLLIWV